MYYTQNITFRNPVHSIGHGKHGNTTLGIVLPPRGRTAFERNDLENENIKLS